MSRADDMRRCSTNLNVGVRLTEGQKQILLVAAVFRGVSLSRFLRDAAIKVAEMDDLVRRTHEMAE